MNVSHASGGVDGPGEGDLELTALTRRTVTAGMLAAGLAVIGGAAWQVLDNPAAGGAAAAQTGDGADQDAAMVASPTPAKQVVIENFTFSPGALTVPVGTEVTWENRDDIPHTVTSDDKTTFASSLLDTGDRFSFTFREAGTFDYFCSVHPMMTARVIVQA